MTSNKGNTAIDAVRDICREWDAGMYITAPDVRDILIDCGISAGHCTVTMYLNMLAKSGFLVLADRGMNKFPLYKIADNGDGTDYI